MSLNPFSNSWLANVQNILCSTGFGDVWVDKYVPNVNSFLASLKQRLTDIFLQERDAFFLESPKCFLFRYLTDTFTLQYYLRKSIPDNLLCFLSKFRLSSHTLAIEQGRYRRIERENRVCSFCNLVEDEYHFILVCPLYNDLRSQYIKSYYPFDHLCSN